MVIAFSSPFAFSKNSRNNKKIDYALERLVVLWASPGLTSGSSSRRFLEATLPPPLDLEVTLMPSPPSLVDP